MQKKVRKMRKIAKCECDAKMLSKFASHYCEENFSHFRIFSHRIRIALPSLLLMQTQRISTNCFADVFYVCYSLHHVALFRRFLMICVFKNLLNKLIPFLIGVQS